MELSADTNAEKTAGLNGVTIVVLGFAVFVGVGFPPLAILVLFICILKMLMKAGRPNALPIQNDTDVYRRFIRPVGRCLVWTPVAALIVVVLLGVALFSMYIVPILMVTVPVVLGLGAFFPNDRQRIDVPHQIEVAKLSTLD